MSNFIDDWVEIPNHHKVPVPTKPSELLHSTYHLVKTNKWKPLTSLIILAEDYPRYGRYCTEYTQHDARFLYFVETAVDVFHKPIFARNGYGINKLQVNADQHLLAEYEKIIEENQALQLHQSRMEKYITLRVKSQKWPYSYNYLPLQPLEASRTGLSKGGGTISKLHRLRYWYITQQPRHPRGQ
ncbi:hypothetical protein DAPPUDRAFT_262488 [Daphnia pulex]|uniref:Uncharacterized protein n=1 Tax=Daphnia pulex TaxID=6669 RepID=E9HN34_DAPPU|nr:hypothetical protein DAPPUDRAFT_262488 [Daphnia pulex]|eukprot:EFX66860.1 hypothetical protein DAPPUDRAFT_262488 [Daphnia pulex]